MKKKILIASGVVVVILIIIGIIIYNKAVKSVPDDGAQTKVKEYDNIRNMRFCEIFLIGGNGITKDLIVAVYNATGENIDYSHDSLNCCPDNLINKLDFEAIKKEYDVLSVYFNKPRFWLNDKLIVPVGITRDFNGLKLQWMASSEMKLPKNVDMTNKSWLEYRSTPVERKTEITFKAGKPVFILDDAEGKVWTMKSYRDSYGQTYESLNTLGERFKKLPAGWKFRVAVIDKDLILRPTGGVAHILQDEFENTFDYLGDGGSNFIP